MTKKPFLEEGHGALVSEAQIVADFFSSSSGFGGFAVHNYRSAYLGGVPDWPSPALPLP